MKRFFFLWVSFFSICFNSFGQTKELIIHSDSLPYLLEYNWKYNTHDNPAYANVRFNDSQWKNIDPLLTTIELNDTIFSGFAWFRLDISIPVELVNKPMVLDLHHLGASDIFVDGLRIASYGKVSFTEIGEVRFNPKGVMIPIIFRDSSHHVIAVRYSNHKFKRYYLWDDFQAGITLKLDVDKNQTFNHYASLFRINVVLLCLGGFLFALTLIHAFFYIYYRKQKYHLYYSLFTFFFALFFFLPYFAWNLNDPDITEPLGYFFPMVVPAYFIALGGFTHYLILEKLPRTLWLSILVGLVILSGFIFKTGHNEIFYTILITIVGYQSSSAIKQGKKLKKEGVRFISIGFAVFMLFLGYIGINILLSVTGIYNGGFSKNTIFFLLPGVLSIPVSISLYMAHNFAALNISLEKKLAEVEKLSAKSIQQEKEKQQMLAEQNSMLEQKVKERTAEVVAQKDLIEEKQQEILASIRYAKRIQMALLPNEKYIDKILKVFRKK